MDEEMLTSEFKRVYRDKKENLDDAMLELRLMGASPIDTIKVIRKCLGIGLREADELVLNSIAWRDVKAGTLQLRSIADTILADSETDIVKADDGEGQGRGWLKSVSAFFLDCLKKLRIR